MDYPFTFGVIACVADPWCWLFLAEVLWCPGCINFISFAREAGIVSLGFLGKQRCTVKAYCDSGSYLRLLGISNFLFLI